MVKNKDQEAVKKDQEVVQPGTAGSAPAGDNGAEGKEKSDLQKRIDQLTARARSAEEKSRMLEEELLSRAFTNQQPQGQSLPATSHESIFPEDDDYALDPEVKKAIDKRVEEGVQSAVKKLSFQQEFAKSEEKVFQKHKDMLGEDGSYNFDSAKVKKYVSIGRKYPQLKNMADGPTIAMRMMEAELEEDRLATERAQAFEEGQRQEANRQNKADKAFTGSSTTKKEPVKKVTLTDAERLIAKRMGITEEEYAANKAKKPILGAGEAVRKK